MTPTRITSGLGTTRLFITTATFEFLPEPRRALLLLSGAAFAALLGRRRRTAA